MGQLRRGKVSVTQGSATVRHVWTAIFAPPPTLAFIAGESISWTGGATGVAVRYDAPAKTLYFTRSSGATPVVGDSVFGGDSTATGTIAQLGELDPPSFHLFLPAGTQRWFSVSGDPLDYPVVDPVSPLGDVLALAFPYAGPTNAEASYGVQNAFTGWDCPILEAGDANAGVNVTRGFRAIEARAGLHALAGLPLSPSVTPIAQGFATGVPFTRVIRDPIGFVQSDGTLKVPAGKSIRVIEVTMQLTLSTGSVGLSLLRAAAGSSQFATWDGMPRSSIQGGTIVLVSGPIVVVDGDQFSCVAQTSGANATAQFSWMSAQVRQ